MSEAVPAAAGDQRERWSDRGEEGRGGRGAAAMVTNLQHVGRDPLGEKTAFRGASRVAHQQ